MDHCYPARLCSLHSSGSKGYMAVAAEMGTKAEAFPNGTTEISHWLCQLLRSLNCKGDKLSEEKSSCTVCADLRSQIEDCNFAYINGQCLQIHEKHMSTENGYKTKLSVASDTPGREFIFAYYNPEGVYLKVFPYKEGKITHKV